MKKRDPQKIRRFPSHGNNSLVQCPYKGTNNAFQVIFLECNQYFRHKSIEHMVEMLTKIIIDTHRAALEKHFYV